MRGAWPGGLGRSDGEVSRLFHLEDIACQVFRERAEGMVRVLIGTHQLLKKGTDMIETTRRTASSNPAFFSRAAAVIAALLVVVLTFTWEVQS